MKIKFYTKHSNIGASSRYRTFQFLDIYTKNNIQCEVSSLFNNKYLQDLYNRKKRSKFNLFLCYAKRFFSIFNAYKYDLIFIEKELFPYMPYFIERIIFIFNKNIILDYDDAVFHNYDNKILLKDKIGKIIKKAKAVTVGSDYIYNYASEYNNKIYKIPTVVDIDKYNIKSSKANSECINIGWIGSPSTTKFLDKIIEPIKLISKKYNISLTLIGADINFSIEGININHVQWSEESEAFMIETFDIGIMPLDNEKFSKGKCGLKLIQYMACGIPVVASPIGENEVIVSSGFDGYLAENTEDWVKYISILINDIELRNKFGCEGRKKVERKYSLEITAKKLIHIFNEIHKERK